MKKIGIYLLVLAVTAQVLLTAFIFFYPEVFIQKAFLLLKKPIFAILDAEEAARQEKIERGEPVAGKDTMIIWNKKYDISKYSNGNETFGDLDIIEKDFSDNIMRRIKKFDEYKDKLYIYSYDGYAVIDEDNICRVFITIPQEDFERGYSLDENGNKTKFYPDKVEHEKVIYLSAFEEFSEKEQEILKKLG